MTADGVVWGGCLVDTFASTGPAGGAGVTAVGVGLAGCSEGCFSSTGHIWPAGITADVSNFRGCWGCPFSSAGPAEGADTGTDGAGCPKGCFSSTAPGGGAGIAADSAGVVGFIEGRSSVPDVDFVTVGAALRDCGSGVAGWVLGASSESFSGTIVVTVDPSTSSFLAWTSLATLSLERDVEGVFCCVSLVDEGRGFIIGRPGGSDAPSALCI